LVESIKKTPVDPFDKRYPRPYLLE